MLFIKTDTFGKHGSAMKIGILSSAPTREDLSPERHPKTGATQWLIHRLVSGAFCLLNPVLRQGMERERCERKINQLGNSKAEEMRMAKQQLDTTRVFQPDFPIWAHFLFAST